MKFSKSILIFLVVASTVSAFYYALERTNGNVYQSIMFTMYFVAIKIGLIGPNIPPKLDQDQPTQQLVSRVIKSPVYQPICVVYNEYRPSGLYMDKIEQAVPRPYVSYHSESVIKELRAGSRLNEAAWLLLTIWMLRQQSVGFQPVRPVVRPPHIEAAHNLLFGKPKTDKFSSQRFETKLEGRKRHRAEIQIDMNDQYQKFLLTKNRNTNCSRQRFEELCRDQKTGRIDFSSIDEALGLLEAEGRGFVEDGYRTKKDVIDADFGVKGPHPYDLADVKTPINWGKGNEDLKAAAERMGKKITEQRSRMQSYGKTPLHIVDLRKLNTSEKTDFKQNVINAIGISKDLVFVNDEVKS